MLEIQSLHLSYRTTILSDIQLTISSGEIIGVVGASGSGKSSLLKVIAGLLDPDAGEVSWNGSKVKGPSQRLVPGHEEIQLVNQDFGLDLYHTVWENVIQKMLYLPLNVRDNFANELLELVDLAELSDQKAYLLSGGEQQRLAIVRALAMEPEVLLLDEPFAHLDAHLKEKIGNYIKKLAEDRNLICILVSHEGADVLEWSDKIVFIDKGKVSRVDNPIAFFFQPSSLYEARFFGEINDYQGVLFRPTEFEVSKTGEIESIKIESRFIGNFWKNKVWTSSGENVVLLSNEELQNGTRFNIKKSHT